MTSSLGDNGPLVVGVVVEALQRVVLLLRTTCLRRWIHSFVMLDPQPSTSELASGNSPTVTFIVMVLVQQDMVNIIIGSHHVVLDG